MNKSFNSKSYCIYGLGVSGKSVVNFFNKNHIKTFSTWDNKTKNFLKNNLKKKKKMIGNRACVVIILSILSVISIKGELI